MPTFYSKISQNFYSKDGPFYYTVIATCKVSGDTLLQILPPEASVRKAEEVNSPWLKLLMGDTKFLEFNSYHF